MSDKTESDAKNKTERKKLNNEEEVQVVSSGRVVKRPKRDLDDIWESTVSPKRIGKKNATKNNDAVKAVEENKAKPKRKRTGKVAESWNNHDITMFYNALKEHGRDWKALYQYIKRHRNNKGAFARSQEDVRQFYYRSWHKISKYIQLPPGLEIDKQVLELFALICYGSVRKKMGYIMDAKVGRSLNELVLKGSTCFRQKGKKKSYPFKVFVPSCPILKKLFNLDGVKFQQKKVNAIRLPETLIVELRPRTNAAWWQVHSMAQNPRVRAKLKPEQNLATVLKHLTRKWRPDRQRVKEQMHESERCWQELKLFPPPTCQLTTWDLSRVYPSKTETCFQRVQGVEDFIQNVKNLNIGQNTLKGRLGMSSRKITIKRPHVPASEPPQTAEDAGNTATRETEPQADPLLNFKKMFSGHTSNNEEKSNMVPVGKSSESLVDLAVETVCDLPDNSAASGKLDSGSAVTSPNSNANTVPNNTVSNYLENLIATGAQMLEKIDNVREGVSVSDAGNVNAAELFLMVGAPDDARIFLDYEWVDVQPDPFKELMGTSRLANSMRRLVDLGVADFATETIICSPPKVQDPPTVTTTCCNCGGIQDNTSSKWQTKKTTPQRRRKKAEKESAVKNPEDEGGGVGEDASRSSLESIVNMVPVSEMSSKGRNFAMVSAVDSVRPTFRIPNAPNVQIRPAPTAVTSRPLHLQYIMPSPSHPAGNDQPLNRFIMFPKIRQRARRPKPMIVQRTLAPRVPSPSRMPTTYIVSPTLNIVPRFLNQTQVKVMNPANLISNAVEVGQEGEMRSCNVVGGTEGIVTSSQYIGATTQQSVYLPSMCGNRQRVNNDLLCMVTSQPPATLSDGNLDESTPFDDQGSLSAMDNVLQNLISSPVHPSVSDIQEVEHNNAQLINVTYTPNMVTFNLSSEGTLVAPYGSETQPYNGCGSNNSLQALLDLSLPSINLDDSTADKFLDIGNSNSQFSVSALLEDASVSAAVQTNLSPSKLLHNSSSSLNLEGEESLPWLLPDDDFHLSNFLTDSPIKSSDSQGAAPSTSLGPVTFGDSLLSKLDVNMLADGSLDFDLNTSDIPPSSTN